MVQLIVEHKKFKIDYAGKSYVVPIFSCINNFLSPIQALKPIKPAKNYTFADSMVPMTLIFF